MEHKAKILNESGLPMLSARRAAQRLECAPDYIGRLCREGKLKGTRVKGAWFVDEASIFAFEKKRATAKAERSEELAVLRRKEGETYRKLHNLPEPKVVSSIPVNLPTTPLADSLFKHGFAFVVGAVLLLSSVALAGALGSRSLVSSGVSDSLAASLARVESPFFATHPLSFSFPRFSNTFVSNFFALFAPRPQVSTAPAPTLPSVPATTQVIQHNYPVIERVVGESDITRAEFDARLLALSQFVIDMSNQRRIFLGGRSSGGSSTSESTSVTVTPAGSTGAIQFNSAGALGASTTALFWDDTNGRLGLGTSTPQSTLHLGNGGVIRLNANDGSTTGCFRQGVGGLEYSNDCSSFQSFTSASAGGWTDDGDVVRLTTGADNVGIGTSTPYAKLTLWGGAQLFEAVTSASTTVFSIGQNGATTTQFAITSVPSALLTTNSSGSVVASSSLSTAYGGTGLSTQPTFGQLLVGNATGGYTLTATTSLGLLASSSLQASAPLSFNNLTGIFSITQGSGSSNGYISSGDWNLFNNKVSSSSLSGASVISYNSSTGVITTVGGTFGSGDYVFPNLVTAPYASTTAITATTASTTNLIVSSLGASAGECLITDASGTVTSTTCGGGSPFPFTPQSWGNATGTTIGFGNGLISNASSTFSSALRLTSLSSGGLAVGATGLVYSAATTTFSTGLTYSNGAVVCDTASGSTFGCLTSTDWSNFNNKVSSSSLLTTLAGNRDWHIVNGALAPTTTLGLLVSASSTIGSGTQAGGLTISGGATTTGNLAVLGTASTTNLIVSSLGASAGECLTTDASGTVTSISCSSGDSFPFTPTTNYGALTNATGTPIWFQAGLQASSTSHFANVDFVNATTSSLYISNLTGPLQAIGGQVSATSTLSVTYGGTGVSTQPTFGQLLLGNSTGGYTLTSTTTLGLLGSTSINASAPLAWNSSTGALTITQSSGSTDGYLSSGDWNLFNNKVSSSSLLTTLAGNRDWHIVNGALAPTTTLGLLVSASSTIGSGTQAGGLTISGGATTTGNLAVLGTASTTNLIISGTQTFQNLSNASLAVNANGQVYSAATTTFSTGLTYSNGAVVCDSASGSTFGCLTSTDWSNFNNKVSSSSLLTTLAGNRDWHIVNGALTPTTTLSIMVNTASSSIFGLNVVNGTTTNATSTSLSVSGLSSLNTLLVSGSSTLQNFTALLATTSQATTTSLAISSISSGSLLKTTTGGAVVAAVAGTDYATLSTINSFKDWHIVNGALAPTTTLGILASASSTIGSGTQAGGLTISGGATTTGNLAVLGTASTTNLIISALPATLLSTNATGGVQATTISAPLQFSGSTLSITQSGSGTDGYLSSTDWNVFNNKISSTSLSGASVISYNSGTGVITTTGGTFGSGDYIFPNKVTIPYASTTVITATTASTTNLIISGVLSSILKTGTDGTVTAAIAGADYLTAANLFGKSWEISNGALAPTTTLGILVSASSTIGSGTQAGGLTISGGATTTQLLVVEGTGTSTFAGNLGVAGQLRIGSSAIFLNGSATSTFSAGLSTAGLSSSAGLFVTAGGVQVSTLQDCNTIDTDNAGNFVCGTDAGAGGSSEINWTYYNGTGVRLSTSSNQVLIGATATTSLAKLEVRGGVVYFENNLGLGSTSPFAPLSVHANNGSTNTTLFAIGSSTQSATTTLFSVSNTGSTTIANGVNLNAGCFAISGTCTVSSIGPTGQAQGGAVTVATSSDTNVGLTVTGAGNTLTFTSTWSGVLSVARGGTNNQNAPDTNALIYFDGTRYSATSSNPLYVGAIVATSTTVNSSIARSLGIGSTTPTARLSILANHSQGPVLPELFNIASSTGSGTTTLFSISNTGVITSNASATSTFSAGLSTAGLSSSAGLFVTAGGVQVSTLQNCDTIDTDNFGNFACGIDTGGGGGDDVNWTFFNTSGVRVATTSNQVLIGATATTSLAKLEVVGGNVYFGSNLGIGTTSPFAKLSVHANNGESGTTLFAVASSTQSSTSTLLTVLNSGNVGVGTSSPTHKLTISGGNISHTASGTLAVAATVAEGGANHTYATYVAGRYAYTADYEGGVRILDISNPKVPSVVGSYSGISSARAIVVAGRYAYVADESTGLVILDVSRPQSPSLVGTYALTGTTHSLVLSGKYVFINDFNNNATRIIDVSDPTSPTLAGSFSGTAPFALAVAGKYLYIASYAPAVQIVDISNPASPALVGSFSNGTYIDTPSAITVSGRYAYITDQVRGFFSLNIANPASPAAVGFYPSNHSADYAGVQVAGNYAYIADHDGRTVVLDLTASTSPSLVTSFSHSATANATNGLFLSGKYAYVARHDEGFSVIDINGTETPSANIGSLEATLANVSDDLIVGNNVSVGGGLDVGISGIFSRGTISAFIASTTQTNPVVANFMGGNVGIGTTSPYARLSVAGQAVASYFTATSTVFASTFPYASTTAITATTASTTNLVVSSVLSSLLKTDASGLVTAAVAGTDYATLSTINSFKDWHIVNGALTPTTTLGVVINASSTIGGGTQTTGLTISGGATTTGNAYFAGNVGVGTASTEFDLTVSGSAQFGDSFDSTEYGKVQITRAADQSDNFFHLSFIRNSQRVAGIGFLDNSSTFGIQNADDNSSAEGIFLDTSNWVGVGSTSPFAKLSIHSNNGGTATTLFAIGSSTASATSTLFSVSNTGSTTIANGVNITAGCFATGGVCLPTFASLEGFKDWSVQGNGYLAPTTTRGIIVSASSTIGSGAQAGGLTISGGATTTGNAYFAGNVAIGTTSPYASSKLSVSGTDSSVTGTATNCLGNCQDNYFTNIQYSVAPSSDQSGTMRQFGFNTTASIPTSNIFAVEAVYSVMGQSYNYGTGAVDRLGGAVLWSENQGLTTVTNQQGAYVGAWNDTGTTTSMQTLYVDAYNNSGTTTNMYGIYTSLSQLGGSVTNRYGLYITEAGSATNDFGIYQASSGQKNYFAGNVGVGTTSPWRALSVNGSSDLGNNALAGYFTATTSTASVFPYASTTAVSVSGTASTTNLVISGIATGNLLKTTTAGSVIAAVAGTDYATLSTINSFKDWHIVNGALTPTTTLSIMVNTASSSIFGLNVVNGTTTNATSTALSVSQLASLNLLTTSGSTTIGSTFNATNGGNLSGTFGGTPTFSNLVTVANLLATGSSTLQNFTGLLATTSQATTTSLAISSISSGSLLKTTTGGAVVAAVGGVDYATTATINSFKDWHIVNGALTPTTTLGVVINASSTIGSGAQAGGLTISGGATTTGNAYFAGNVGIGTVSPTAELHVSGAGLVMTRIATLDTTGYSDLKLETPGRGYELGVGGSAVTDGVANKFFIYDDGADEYGLVLDSTYLGLGTTSPFAKISIHGNPNDNALATTLFAIGSSTATATTTLFSVSNTGSTTLASTFGTCSGSSALTTNSSGTIICGTVTGSEGVGNWFVADTFGASAANSTSTLIKFTQGIASLASSTIGAGGQATGLTIYGGATTTGNAYFAGSVAIGTTTPANQFHVESTGDVRGHFLSQGNAFINLGTGTASDSRLLVGWTGGSGGYGSIHTSASGGFPLVLQEPNGALAGGNVGIGTTSPYAKLSIFAGANYTSQAAATLFAIGSTSAGTATTTLFSVSNTGSTTIANGVNITAGCFATGGICLPTFTSLEGFKDWSVQGNGYLAPTTTRGIIVSASSTIGGGTQTTGLTISGGATTTGTAYFAGNVGIKTTDTSTYTLNVNGAINIPRIQTDFSADDSAVLYVREDGNFETGEDPLYLRADGFRFFSIEDHEFLTATRNGNVGVGSSSPFAKFSIQSNNGDTATTLFAIGSSTQTSTSTLFSVSNIGSTTLASTFGTCSGSNALTTNSSGTIVCGSVTGDGVGNWFTPTTNFGVAVNSTSTPIWFTQGIMASTTSYIGSTTFAISGNVGIGSSTPFAKLSINNSGNDTTPFAIRTNGSVGNYTPQNSGIFFYDAAGNETLRIFASDPNTTDNFNSGNLYIGSEAGASNETDNVDAGFYNTGIGILALTSNTTGTENTAVGKHALRLNTTGIRNVAVGSFSLWENTTGRHNVAVGDRALMRNHSATTTVAIGSSAGLGTALYSNQGGVYIGVSAGQDLGNGSDFNTLLGYQSGSQITSGYANILLGASVTENNLTTGSGNIGLGNEIFFPSATANNQLNIGNLLYGTIPATTTAFQLPTSGSLGVGTSSPFAKFSIATNNGDTETILFAIGSSTASATSTLFSIDNVGNTFINDPAASGVGTKLYVYDLQTNENGSENIYADLTATNNSAAANFYYNIRGNLSYTGTADNTGQVLGVYNVVDSANSGTLTTAVGAFNQVSQTAGTITDAIGTQSYIFGSGGTMTNAYGFYAQLAGGNTINNGYGLYITNVNATNDYGVYQVGVNDSNYFAGNTGVGTTSPFANLSIHADTLGPINRTLFAIGSSTASATTTHFVVTNTGMVGIGTTSLNAPLTVQTSGDEVGIRIFGVGGAGSNSVSSLQFIDSDGATVRANLGDLNTGDTDFDIVSGVGSKIQLTANENAIESLTIDTNGNVGIGSSSAPFANLSVQKNYGSTNTTLFAVASSTHVDGDTANTFFSVSNIGSTTLASTFGSCNTTSALTTDSSGTIVCGAITGTGDGVGSWFVPNTNFGTAVNSTSTTIWFTQGLQASSTIRFGNAGVTPFFYDGSVGNLGLGTTSPFATLQIATTTGKNLVLSDSAAAANLKHWLLSSLGGSLYIGTTTDSYSTSSVAALTILNNGRVGFGSSTPYAKISISAQAGESATTLLAISSSTSATTTTFGTVSNTGVFSWGNDGSNLFTVDASSGTTTIANLSIGNISFETNAGVVNLSDLPVDSNAAAGVVQSQSIALDSTPILTIYSESTGGGGIRNTAIGIGTTSPVALLTVYASPLASSTYNSVFTVASSTAAGVNTTLFNISNIGSTTLASNFGQCGTSSALTTNSSGTIVCGAITGGAASTTLHADFNTFTGQNMFLASTTIGAGGQATGLTISGGATTTGNAYFAGNVGIRTTAPTGRLHISTDETDPALVLTDTVDGDSVTFTFTSPIGGGVDLNINNTNGRLIYNGHSIRNSLYEDPGGNSSLTLSTGVFQGADIRLRTSNDNIDVFSGGFSEDTIIRPYTSEDVIIQDHLNNPLVIVKNSGNVGLGTTTPFGKFAVSLKANESAYPGNYAFIIASSTASATTTLFSVSNTGLASTTYFYGAGLATCQSENVLTWSGGLFGCEADTAGSGGSDFTFLSISGSIAAATTSPLAIFNNSYFGATGTTTITSAGFIGVASSSPWAPLSVHANNGSTNTTLFAIGSSTQSATTTLFSVSNTGVATFGSSAGTGDASIQFGDDDNAWSAGYEVSSKAFVIASSTTLSSNVALSIAKGGNSTTTLSGLNISGSATSTSNVGFNITDGCYAIDSVCVGGGSASLTGSTGQVAYFSATDTAIGTSTLTISTASLVGVASSSPWGLLSVNPDKLGSRPSFVIGSSTGTSFIVNGGGRVGIGTTSPSALFSINPTSAIGTANVFAIGSSTKSIFTVSNAGNVTVGDSSGTGDATFQFASDSNAWSVGYNSSDKSFRIASSTSFTSNVALAISKSSLNVGVGTTSPWRQFSVTGTIGLSSTASAESGNDEVLCIDPGSFEVTRGGASCGASSLRFKENIQNINYGLDTVLALRPVTFNWKQSERPGATTTNIGFIAEEVYEIIPEVVEIDSEGLPGGIDYNKLTAVLAKAVQELNTDVQIISSTTISIASTTDSLGTIQVVLGQAQVDISDDLADIQDTLSGLSERIVISGDTWSIEGGTASSTPFITLSAGTSTLLTVAGDIEAESINTATSTTQVLCIGETCFDSALAASLATTTATSSAEDIVAGAYASTSQTFVESFLNFFAAIPEFAQVGIKELGVAVRATVGVFDNIFTQTLTATILTAEEVHAGKLCLEDVCVTKSELEALLSGSGSSESNSSTAPEQLIEEPPATTTEPVVEEPTATSTETIIEPAPVVEEAPTEEPPAEEPPAETP